MFTVRKLVLQMLRLLLTNFIFSNILRGPSSWTRYEILKAYVCAKSIRDVTIDVLFCTRSIARSNRRCFPQKHDFSCIFTNVAQSPNWKLQGTKASYTFLRSSGPWQWLCWFGLTPSPVGHVKSENWGCFQTFLSLTPRRNANFEIGSSKVPYIVPRLPSAELSPVSPR